MKTPNDQAFPCFNGDQFTPTLGLTKREYFAAMAMQGLLAHNCDHFKDSDLEKEGVANRSVQMADALIAELNNESEIKMTIDGSKLEGILKEKALKNDLHK